MLKQIGIQLSLVKHSELSELGLPLKDGVPEHADPNFDGFNAHNTANKSTEHLNGSQTAADVEVLTLLNSPSAIVLSGQYVPGKAVDEQGEVRSNG